MAKWDKRQDGKNGGVIMARPKKEKETRTLNLKIDSSIFNLLDDYSKNTGISKTFIVEKTLNDFLEHNKKEIKAVN